MSEKERMYVYSDAPGTSHGKVFLRNTVPDFPCNLIGIYDVPLEKANEFSKAVILSSGKTAKEVRALLNDILQ
ncbi:hypothetical protein GF354_00575 [Candidatus Peregrinibacteria bacterium]|nr:hypothetical protein [Candidatus Peregrinibacteria bacterium]